MIKKLFISMLIFGSSLLTLPVEVYGVCGLTVDDYYALTSGDHTTLYTANDLLNYVGQIHVYDDIDLLGDFPIFTITDGVIVNHGSYVTTLDLGQFKILKDDEFYFFAESDGAIDINNIYLGDYIRFVFYVYDGNTVTFESNGGSYVAPITCVIEGETIIKPSDPTRAGYTFIGWYKASNLISAWNFNIDEMPDNSITLYAKWVQDVDDNLNEFIDEGGLGSAFGKMLVSVLLTIILMIVFALFDTPKLIILLIGVSCLLLFIALGWIPIWITILLTIIVFGLFFLSLKGGGGND